MVATKPHEQSTPNSPISGPLKFFGCARGYLGRLESLFMIFAIICILGICGVITASVILRTFFDSGVPDEVVIVGEMMIGALVLPLAFVAANRGFISVEIVTQNWGEKWQQALNVLTVVVGLVAVAPITYAAFLSVMDAFQTSSFFFGLLSLPKWPGHTLFFLGYVLFFIRLIDLAIYDTLTVLGMTKSKQLTPNYEEVD